MTSSSTRRTPKEITLHWRDLIGSTVRRYLDDGVPMLAAGSAYYLLVTLAPMLLVLIWVADTLVNVAAGLPLDLAAPEVLGSQAAGTPTATVGLASVADSYFQNVSQGGTLIALGIALFGATVFVSAFIRSLDKIFGLGNNPMKGWKIQLRRRGLALLTLVIVVMAQAVVAIIARVLSQLIERAEETLFAIVTLPPAIDQALNAVFWASSGMLFFLITFAFTFLPARRIKWKDSLVGAALTTLAMLIGQQVLGIYLDSSSIISAFGAMSAFLAFMIWAYYTMQVLLSGAEFTRVWADDAEEKRAALSQPASSGEDA